MACDRCGCDRMFGDAFARRVARKYRKRGLDRTARRMVAFLEQRGVDDATVLEIGGGIGEISLELLERGARHAVNLELSPAYDSAAAELAEAAGLVDRVERRQADLAAEPRAAEPADVVVLHRVVCCYPDYARLLAAAAAHARRMLVFSHPPAHPLARALVTAQNAALRLRRSPFRVFTHPPQAMLAVLHEQGMRTALVHRGRVWHVVGVERAPAPVPTTSPRI